jgi:hypothetical protein
MGKNKSHDVVKIYATAAVPLPPAPIHTWLTGSWNKIVKIRSVGDPKSYQNKIWESEGDRKVKAYTRTVQNYAQTPATVPIPTTSIWLTSEWKKLSFPAGNRTADPRRESADGAKAMASPIQEMASAESAPVQQLKIPSQDISQDMIEAESTPV